MKMPKQSAHDRMREEGYRLAAQRRGESMTPEMRKVDWDVVFRRLVHGREMTAADLGLDVPR